ncbi:Rv3235 family protein [Georgenia yuyongxinii]
MSTTTLVRPALVGRHPETAMVVPRTAAPAAPLPAHPGTATSPHVAPALPATRAAVPRIPTRWDPVRFTGPAAPPPPAPKGSPFAAAIALAAAAGSTPPALPPPAPCAAALARCAVEVLVGLRPATQLARYLTTELYESLARRAGLAERILGRPSRTRHTAVRRVHVCHVGPRTVEASVVVHDGARIRAAAVRLEAHRGRWRATALEIG